MKPLTLQLYIQSRSLVNSTFKTYLESFHLFPFYLRASYYHFFLSFFLSRLHALCGAQHRAGLHNLKWSTLVSAASHQRMEGRSEKRHWRQVGEENHLYELCNTHPSYSFPSFESLWTSYQIVFEESASTPVSESS